MKKLIISLFLLLLFPIAIVLGINQYVVSSTSNSILTIQEAQDLSDIDCILVLGAGVYANGEPSPMLQDRIDTGVTLYQKNVSEKILMSGDHGTLEYDEVNTMKDDAINQGVPSFDIFMDHAGFSTYESMVRAKEVFGAKKIVIVTQQYHLYRALYIAHSIGLEAYGVSADLHSYGGQAYRDLREILARDKDVINCIRLPEPTYLGEPIDLKGSGDVTNDK